MSSRKWESSSMCTHSDIRKRSILFSVQCYMHEFRPICYLPYLHFRYVFNYDLLSHLSIQKVSVEMLYSIWIYVGWYASFQMYRVVFELCYQYEVKFRQSLEIMVAFSRVSSLRLEGFIPEDRASDWYERVYHESILGQ